MLYFFKCLVIITNIHFIIIIFRVSLIIHFIFIHYLIAFIDNLSLSNLFNFELKKVFIIIHLFVIISAIFHQTINYTIIIIVIPFLKIVFTMTIFIIIIIIILFHFIASRTKFELISYLFLIIVQFKNYPFPY